jgi:hypothetical protein
VAATAWKTFKDHLFCDGQWASLAELLEATMDQTLTTSGSRKRVLETHVALVGDSTFDSRPYLHGKLDMAERLSRDANCRATLLTGSGSRLADVARQLTRVPSEATTSS